MNIHGFSNGIDTAPPTDLWCRLVKQSHNNENAFRLEELATSVAEPELEPEPPEPYHFALIRIGTGTLIFLLFPVPVPALVRLRLQV
jgi:hypothetical protein